MQDHRPLRSERLEQPPDLEEQLLGQPPRRRCQSLEHRPGDASPAPRQRLDQRPERDPLAVRADSGRSARVARVADLDQQLRDQPRLPHAGRAQQREQMTARLGDRALPRLPQQAQLALAAHERHVEAARETRRERIDTPAAGNAAPARTCPSAQAARAARPRPRRGPAAASRRRAGSPRAARPAPAARPHSPHPRSPGSPPRRPAPGRCSRRCGTRNATPISSATAGNRSRISAAARTARNASSSCTRGIPNTAITASPMNFSTVPPWRSIIARISSKYRLITASSASGSSSSPSAVEPVTSQNSTVTTLRS